MSPSGPLPQYNILYMQLSMKHNLCVDYFCFCFFVCLGVFLWGGQGEYRAAMAKELLKGFKELGVPHTDEPNLVSTLGDPVNIRTWQVGGNLFIGVAYFVFSPFLG